MMMLTPQAPSRVRLIDSDDANDGGGSTVDDRGDGIN